MYYLFRAIRRLGFEDAALRLLAPFCRRTEPIGDVDAALSLLHSVSPDECSSCIRTEPRRTESSDRDVDVIVPCYNAESTVASCIRSVLEQETVCRFRVIAIDDGSTDSTLSILQSFGDDPRLLVIHQENRGFSGARNRGLDSATASYVSFLDSDDTLAPGALEALFRCAVANDAEVVEGAIDIVGENGAVFSSFSHSDGPIDEPGSQSGFPCGALIRRRVFTQLEFPLGCWYEDSVMFQIIFPLLRSLERHCFSISDTVYRYYSNPRGISRSGVKRPKCLDALYVHLHMYADRQRLGLAHSDYYYHFMLRMVALCYVRTRFQPEEVRKAIFTVWVDFFGKSFCDFRADGSVYSALERSLRTGNYGLYRLCCQLM